MHSSLILILLVSFGITYSIQSPPVRGEVAKHVTAVIKAVNKDKKEELYKMFRTFETGKEDIVKFIRNFKKANFKISSAKYTNNDQNIETALVFVPKKTGSMNIEATWYMEKSSESPTGWRTWRVSMSSKKHFGKKNSDLETAACATEPLICAVMAKKRKGAGN